ncbi:MAG: putative molybdenum carrier protein [Thiohalobacterales bacterium]|nr:putative molybdenum carrier protein [Thiohalobacterales bacterium]
MRSRSSVTIAALDGNSNPESRVGRYLALNQMLRIVSGGQTGVDRGALDAALESGVDCGGWVPAGRKAEDGTVPDIYPVKELIGGGYDDRTRKNVQDSDGTVIIYFDSLSGGTEQTLRYCLSEAKPYLLIDGQEIAVERSAERIAAFIGKLEGECLNVAGPRGGSEPRAYSYAKTAMMKAIRIFTGK